MAYAGYRAEISVKFYPAASFIPPFEQHVDIDKVQSGATLSETATVDEKIDIPVRPPNRVREDAGMKLPYLTSDAHGNPVEAWKDKPQKGAPKNKVKGGSTGKDGDEPLVTMVPTAIPVAKSEVIR